MTYEGTFILSEFFGNLWEGLGNVTIPCTNLNGQMILLGQFALWLLFWFLKHVIPFGISSGRGKNSKSERKDK